MVCDLVEIRVVFPAFSRWRWSLAHGWEQESFSRSMFIFKCDFPEPCSAFLSGLTGCQYLKLSSWLVLPGPKEAAKVPTRNHFHIWTPSPSKKQTTLNHNTTTGGFVVSLYFSAVGGCKTHFLECQRIPKHPAALFSIALPNFAHWTSKWLWAS